MADGSGKGLTNRWRCARNQALVRPVLSAWLNRKCRAVRTLACGQTLRPMERSAVIYAIGDRLVVGASCRTPAGFRVDVEPRTLSMDASAEEFALALSNALAVSSAPIAPPRDWKSFFDPFLKAAGVRSHKAFMAATRLVSVDERDGTYTVMPSRNLGAKQGFEGDPAQAINTSDLGQAASLALAKLRSA